MTTEVAAKCLTSVIKTLQSIAAVSGKVFQIYSEDELMDKTKGMVFPCAGVVYEGMRAISEGSKDTNRQGLSAELVLSILIFFRPDALSPSNTKTSALNLLDDVRDSIKGTRSPSGHLWRFVVEAAATEKHGVVVYIQRWTTPVQLA